jgi:hypothetical protein
MDTRIIATVFEWRGEIYVSVDRVGRASDRRYAPRHRIATWTATTRANPSEAQAAEYMITILGQWLAEGMPRGLHVPRQGLPGAPGGGGGDRRVATGKPASRALQSQEPPSRLIGSDAVGVSDGLQPPGEQLTVPGTM